MEKALSLLFVCHQLPHRSFFYKGKQFPICARCTGILIGYFIGIVLLISTRNIPFIYSICSLLPLVIDGVGQYLQKWESTNSRRLFTGIIAGVGTVYIFFTIIHIGYLHGHKMASFFL